MEPQPRQPIDINSLLARLAELEAAVSEHKDMNGTMTADQILWAVIEEDANV